MQFWSANALEVEVGTNTPQGGDSGHGGITIFAIKDLAGTDWRIKVTNGAGQEKTIFFPKSIELILGGDCEAGTFIEVLRYALYVLDTQNSKQVTLGAVEKKS